MSKQTGVKNMYKYGEGNIDKSKKIKEIEEEFGHIDDCFDALLFALLEQDNVPQVIVDCLTVSLTFTDLAGFNKALIELINSQIKRG